MGLSELVGGLYEKTLKLSALAVLSSSLSAQCGDCNRDGLVNINDAFVAAQNSAQIITLPASDFEKCNVEGLHGDSSSPGATVDILDALKMARAVAGLESITCNYEKVIYVVFNDSGGSIVNSNLHIMAIDGSNSQPLTLGNGFNEYPEWFPTSQKVVYSSNLIAPSVVGSNLMICTMNWDGSGKNIITQGNGDSTSPSWLDANTIVYQSTENGNWDIFKVDINTGIKTELTNHPDYDIQPTCWNGTIAFITPRDGYPNLYTMDRNGANLRRETIGVDCSEPFFINNKIYFAHRQSITEQHIWSVDTTNGQYDRHTQGQVFDNHPSLDNTENTLYFSRGAAFLPGYDIMKKDITTGDISQLTSSTEPDKMPVYMNR